MSIILREDVAFCIANKRVALLDVKGERYFCLPDRADAAFQALLSGAQTDLSPTGALAPLFARGYLIDDDRPLPIINPDAPIVTAMEGFDVSRPSTHLHMFGLALLTQLATRMAFTSHSLAHLIGRLRRRKNMHSGGETAVLSHKQSEALASFLLTKLLISNQDRCLHRSVALLDFLALYGAYPDLVIGVRLAPFSFHAWVQADTVVLNDDLDTVLPYTPILVV